MVLSSNLSSHRSPWSGYEQRGPLSTNAAERRWHVTPSGDLKPCKALQGKCPYGGSMHVEGSTLEVAQRAVVAQKELLDPQAPKNHFKLGAASDPRKVGDARDIATFAERVEEERGVAADKVELDGFMSLEGSDRVSVRRRVDRRAGSPDKSLAYWELSVAGKPRKVKITYLTDAKLDELIDPAKLPGQGVHFQAETRAELTEAKEELKHRLRETILTVEAEADLARPTSVHRAIVETPPRFTLDESGKLSGRLNYGSTGFRPEHLRGIKTGNGISDKMSVVDTDAGAGAAAWSMVHKDGQWQIEVTGTRGDKKTFYGSTSEEVRAQVEDYFAKRVKMRNLQSRAKRLDTLERRLWEESPRDATSVDQRANRVDFMAKMIDESAAYAQRVRAEVKAADRKKSKDDHRELFGEDKEKKGFGKLFSMLG